MAKIGVVILTDVCSWGRSRFHLHTLFYEATNTHFLKGHISMFVTAHYNIYETFSHFTSASTDLLEISITQLTFAHYFVGSLGPQESKAGKSDRKLPFDFSFQWRLLSCRSRFIILN